ncbi:uncharacterized protein F5891DRAFT_671061 [Suillus fuscotomentosus]|uniref:Uncharacterized protein n=1 Tax=Suillus fuscotomentosus TaxID=1912939 RepID=A0AAD4DWW9_9AGAM|nr:uncharacterized protein F5891DRAFT_671061 [Suillus fuscotomentosus]KAG1895370.1 hypothetical protein F5891DRAFT_671061 [Suillus fuscotomentosus]
MAPSPLAESLKPIILLFFLLLPYAVALLPSILKSRSHSTDLLFNLAGLITIIIIANLYYLISWAPCWFGLLSHDWGCAIQFFNWVVHLTYMISMSGLQIFSVPMVAVLLLILFPAMELVFWILVGSGKEKVHLHVYGEIHDWIALKWGNLLMVPGCLDRVTSCLAPVKQIVVEALEWVGDVLTAIRDCFPRHLPQEFTLAGMDYPPAYSSVFTHDLASSSTSADMTGAVAKV